MSSWQQRHPCLAGFQTLQDLLDACGADQSIAMELADQRLAAVVAEARAGDPVAARLSLQRVFPALLKRASHRVKLQHRQLDGVLEELMSTAWLVITQFPLERRPVKIAVNIIRDAEYGLYGYVPVAARRTIVMPAEELAYLPRKDPSPRSPYGADPQDRLGEVPRMLLDAVEAGFPVSDARLLTQLFVFDQTIAEIAAEEGASARGLRFRRKNALGRLAAHVGCSPQAVAAGCGESA